MADQFSHLKGYRPPSHTGVTVVHRFDPAFIIKLIGPMHFSLSRNLEFQMSPDQALKLADSIYLAAGYGRSDLPEWRERFEEHTGPWRYPG